MRAAAKGRRRKFLDSASGRHDRPLRSDRSQKNCVAEHSHSTATKLVSLTNFKISHDSEILASDIRILEKMGWRPFVRTLAFICGTAVGAGVERSTSRKGPANRRLHDRLWGG